MEYVYAALLLHSAGKPVEDASVRKVLEAAGVQVDEAKLKSLTAALQGVNIEEALKQAVVAAAPVQGGSGSAPAEKKEEKKEEEAAKTEEEASAGLAALFG
jgi:large subunit ribosomal protein L12